MISSDLNQSILDLTPEDSLEDDEIVQDDEIKE